MSENLTRYTLELHSLTLEELNAMRQLAQLLGIQCSCQTHQAQPADTEEK